MRRLILALTLAAACMAQIDGNALYSAFRAWQKAPENARLDWAAAVLKYSAKLKAEGLAEPEVAKMIRIIEARDEAILYDPAFAGPPKFQTTPSALLMEAVHSCNPGRALDVAMGQGRNSIYLAKQGWQVTGFDVSSVGIRAAERHAREAGVQIQAVLASDEEFDFGTSQWDLIALLYPIEKRSVNRVREALKPGGIVVLECTHKSVSNGPFEYDTDELLRIFKGFRIIKYQDAIGTHEWSQKKERLVRLIAEK